MDHLLSKEYLRLHLRVKQREDIPLVHVVSYEGAAPSNWRHTKNLVA